jgi:hypothetical protein
VAFRAGDQSFEDALEAVERLQALMVARAQGQLSGEEQNEYQDIRRALLRDGEFRSRLPRLVTANGDLGGVWSDLREHSGQWESRRVFVREQLRGALDYAMELAARDASVESSRWTGIQSQRERLIVARKLLPLAQASVEGLIAELERPQGNGGPPLEHRQEAIDNLKAFHAILGQCIADLESGRGSLKDVLLKEAAGFIARACRALKGDPMPYLVAGGLAGMLSLLGAGELGSFLAGIALNFRKNASLG